MGATVEEPTERVERQPVVAAPTKTLDDAPKAVVDAVRYLVASLERQNAERPTSWRLGLTSALAGEGVSFICQTVAAVVAHDYRERVCLIDLNWSRDALPTGRSGARHRRKGRRYSAADHPEPGSGLADVLRRQVPLRDVITPTDDPSFTMVAAGSATAAEGEVFARSEELSRIINALGRRNDRLIFDLPAVLVSSSAITLARQADAVGLVVRHGVTTETQAKAALDLLGQIPSVGVVLNRSSSKIPRPLLRRLASW